MALSKPKILGTPQHFLECGLEDCERNCEFYCNSCHRLLCKQCRDKHLMIPENKNHEVVLYQQRKRQLPVEKCNIHPTKEIDILCKECSIPLCSKCSTMEEHWGHHFIDLETIYTDKFGLCQKEISKIHNYFIPTSQDLQREVQEDATEVKQIMDNIRTSMKAEAESLKNMVDKVLSENMEELHQIEQTLLEKLKSQEKIFNDYIVYLSDLVKKFQSYLSATELTNFTTKLPDNLKIKSIPETTKPVTPEFSPAQYNKKDVSKLLGKITVTDRKGELRRVKPMEIPPIATSMKSTCEQTKQDKHVKSDKKQTVSLSASVTKVREFKVPGVDGVCHTSLYQSDRLWISDDDGNLVQTDLQGNVIQKIKTSGRDEGYHTVTQDGDLIFTDKNKKVINRITQDNKITEFIKTEDWKPLSIHSSHINGDLLVGMSRGIEVKVTRYNKTGKELQNIQRDNKGKELYRKPHYITENINGDICTSDYWKGVVVVNKSGQHRFSYTGQESGFSPYGICTDVLGHILVCDRHSTTIHLLNQDSQFLSLLLTKQQEVDYPCSVCVDDENKLYVGQWFIKKLTVYKYLQ
ncbi:tripartite motif-containing protein 2-like [Saccostrea echinata]|uniref:tripartite motif-containing protein 2-like n=1 Tax=Saccostrea echinata TaxID=191078 RepID=UPI002A7F2611|nr:tripartite motif-containing protein 2-like [Saccostrea echinata]